MKHLIAIVFISILAMLTGCASLQNAGSASYSVKPFVTDAKTGAIACCEVSIQNGKEIANLEAHVSKQGDSYTVDLKEQGVVAFQGQQIAAGAAQGAIDAAAKVAVAAALAPLLPALIPAAGAMITSGATGAVVGGAALGIGAEQMLKPSTTLSQPKP